MLWNPKSATPVIAAISFCASSIAHAADWNADTLSGDWGGLRTRMSDAGAELQLGYKGDLLSTLEGGTRRGTKYLDLWEAKLSLDGDRLWGWSGVTAFLHVISNHGGKFNTQHVSSAQGVDNIEVVTNTTKIFQAWVQKAFLDGAFSVQSGLIDLNAEFYVTESSAVFLHPTFGMASDLGQTGQSGPSIYPTTSFGVSFKYAPAPSWYAQAIVLDGVPGSPDNPHGTHVQFNRGDGTLAVAETGWMPWAGQDGGGLAKYAVGVWRYTPRFDDLIDTDASGNPRRRVNRGAYVLAEHTLMREAGDPEQGLSGFVRLGVASADINRFDKALGTGLIYRGLLPGRDRDILGFAIAAEHNSRKHREAMQLAGAPEPAAEVAYELTYRAQVYPWLAVQPELQLVKNHGEPVIRDTWLGGVRVEISF